MAFTKPIAVPSIDATRFASVIGTQLYSILEASALMGMSPKTTRLHIQSGKLRAQRHPLTNRIMIYGADILATVAPLLAAMPQAKAGRETQAQREERAKRAMADMRNA
jgi:hypothetical protein